MSKDTDDAIKRASDRAHEYQVEGYGRQDDGYGGPYHPDAFKDPQVEFALAGAPEEQVKFSKDLRKLDEAKSKNGAVDQVDLVAASAHSTVVKQFPHRVTKKATAVPATPENVQAADDRKPVHEPAKKAAAPVKKTAAKKTAAKKAATKRTFTDTNKK